MRWKVQTEMWKSESQETKGKKHQSLNNALSGSLPWSSLYKAIKDAQVRDGSRNLMKSFNLLILILKSVTYN